MTYVYPDAPLPSEGYTFTDEYATLISGPYPSGRSVTGKQREYPLFRVSLRYTKMLQADFDPITALHRTVKGSYGTFTYFDFAGHDLSPVGAVWTGLYVGVGNGSTVEFDLPMKNATTRTVYVNGATPAYTFSSGGGSLSDGRDKVTFSSAPANGHIITLTATGRRAVTCRFASDSLQIVRYAAGLVEGSVEIVEAR